MAKFTGIKGNIIDTQTVVGQRIKGPPPKIGEYISIEGDIKNATTVTGQIFQSADQPPTDSPISVNAAPQGASDVPPPPNFPSPPPPNVPSRPPPNFPSRPPPNVPSFPSPYIPRPPPPNVPSPPPPNFPSPPPPNVPSSPPPYIPRPPPPSPPPPNIPSPPPPNVPSSPPPNIPRPPPPNIPRPPPPNVPRPPDVPSSSHPGNISNHGQEDLNAPSTAESIPGVPFENLHNDNPRELLHIVRHGKMLSLWEIEQIQIQYGLFHDIPWSILGFRLKKGVDKKDCLEVRVEGIVKSRGADIKGIWPSRKINDLVEFETKRSSGLQFRIGIDSTAKALTSLALTTAMEHTFVTGQTLVPEFEQERFVITLGVKKGSPRGTCVADLVEFYILVQLSKERAAMTLEVTANVVYKGWSRKKLVQGQEVCVYSGDEKDDIRKINVQRG